MDIKSNCIVLTGGGTAGHIMVNINLKNELEKSFNQIIYIGSKNGIENELISKQTPYHFESIDCVKFNRNGSLKNLLIPFKLAIAINQAKKLLIKYKPQIIFSKGGYVGLPVVIAGKSLKIPIICHESDITMGLANKIAKNYADVICTSFKQTAEKNGQKCTYTSMPLKLSNLTKEQAKEKLKIKTTKPILLVTGGSLGAKAINEFIFKNIDELSKNYFILHLVGKNNLNRKINNSSYKQIDFSDDMWTIFKASDYAISRAGANTIIELLSNKILTIFIPLPKTVSRGDQIDNALFLEQKGLCKTILQENLNLTNLQNALNYLKTNSQKIKENIKTENIVDGTNNIISIINKHKLK